jgi:hypothetical protein
MKVHELIKELKKMPKDSEVYVQDHDHSEYEYNGRVKGVRLLDYDKPISQLPEDSQLSGTVVMIRL